ncbi:MAG: thiamine pyrophosphate-dependent enzyme [Pirellulales bacterium]
MLDAVVRHKRPGYLEIPRDMVHVVPDAINPFKQTMVESDPLALQEAVADAVAWIERAERPCIVAGVEIHRFGLQEDLLALAEGSQIGICATMLGKSVVSEYHPLYVGLYEGAMGRAEVSRFVEESDCVLLLGTFMTDLNLGVYTANLNPTGCIYVTSEQLRIRHHHYHDVQLEDFLRELARANPCAASRKLPPGPAAALQPYVMEPDRPLSITRIMLRINESLEDDTAVIADVGDSLFAATELVVRQKTEFLAPAYYTSMGYAVPAALGVSVAGRNDRVVAIVGDGAFQMTGMELSTIIRHGYRVVLIILDNKGYGTERFLHPGDFNEIHPWNYAKLPEVLGGGIGYEVRTEGEFDRALRKAWDEDQGLSIIQAHLSVDDASNALHRLAEKLSKRV